MDSWEFVKEVKNEVVEKYSLILILLIYYLFKMIKKECFVNYVFLDLRWV